MANDKPKTEKELLEMEKALATRADELDKREKALDEREAALKKKTVATGDAQGLSKADEKLIADGCEAYGIGEAHVLAANIDAATGEAVIVTRGGSKVRYAKGADVKPLGQIAVTGVNPDAKKKKPVAGRKKAD